eukprot:1157205-Pelagomonas_calceolata.AAC.4
MVNLKVSGQAGDSTTSSLPGGGKQKREVLSGVLCGKQEVWQAAMQHQPSRYSQVLGGGSEWCWQMLAQLLESAAEFPQLTEAAGQLLPAHVMHCVTERMSRTVPARMSRTVPAHSTRHALSQHACHALCQHACHAQCHRAHLVALWGMVSRIAPRQALPGIEAHVRHRFRACMCTKSSLERVRVDDSSGSSEMSIRCLALLTDLAEAEEEEENCISTALLTWRRRTTVDIMVDSGGRVVGEERWEVEIMDNLVGSWGRVVGEERWEVENMDNLVSSWGRVVGEERSEVDKMVDEY